MTKYVGVSDFFLLEDEGLAKRAALMFDLLSISGMTAIGAMEKHPQDFVEHDFQDTLANSARDLQARHAWLIREGIIHSAPPEFGSEALAERLLKVFFTEKEMAPARESLQTVLDGPEGDSFHDDARSGISRRAALRLQAETGWDTVVFGQLGSKRIDFVQGKDSVAEIVLKALPVPEGSTPWEDILEYRRDPDSRRRFLRLKNWMNRALDQDRSPQDLHDEIQTLVAEYEDHMKLHRMKVEYGGLETLITSSAEILESLVRVRWTKAAKALFSIRRRRVQLLEAERKAPGRQLAYLAHVRGHFRRGE